MVRRQMLDAVVAPCARSAGLVEEGLELTSLASIDALLRLAQETSGQRWEERLDDIDEGAGNGGT